MTLLIQHSLLYLPFMTMTANVQSQTVFWFNKVCYTSHLWQCQLMCRARLSSDSIKPVIPPSYDKDSSGAQPDYLLIQHSLLYLLLMTKSANVQSKTVFWFNIACYTSNLWQGQPMCRARPSPDSLLYMPPTYDKVSSGARPDCLLIQHSLLYLPLMTRSALVQNQIVFWFNIACCTSHLWQGQLRCKAKLSSDST